MSKLYIYQIRVFIIDIACILRFVHGVGFIYIFPRTRVRLSSIALKSEINTRVGVAHLGTRIICRRILPYGAGCCVRFSPYRAAGGKHRERAKFMTRFRYLYRLVVKTLCVLTWITRFLSNLFFKKIQRRDDTSTLSLGAFMIKTYLLDKRIRKEKRSLIRSATRVTPEDCNSETHVHLHANIWNESRSLWMNFMSVSLRFWMKPYVC